MTSNARLVLCFVLPLAAACAESAGGGVPRDLGPGGGGDLRGADAASAKDLATAPSDFAGFGADMSSGGPDLATVDLAPQGFPWGTPCTVDGDCASGLCKAVLGGNSVCVQGCKQQSDCTGLLNSFCEATTANSPDGYCIPRSPMHCATCAKDSDCGVLAERCLTGPGDITPACHIDCALAGAAACPSDYDCAAVTDNGMQRMLCVPKLGVCLDSLGGFCDRVSLPQPCQRTNMAGYCNGQRVCLSNGQRYDTCSAMSPQYRTCSQQNPAGCMEAVDPSTLNTAQNCGACGNACPGYGLANVNVACTDPQNKICSFSCQGDNYDVNNNASDGCEIADVPPPGHDTNGAEALTSQSCDSTIFQKFTGVVASDSRSHNPTPTAFSGTVGADPDYWSVHATGGTFCLNDYGGTFSVTGGGNTSCYKLTILTDKTTTTAQTTGNASVSFSSPDSSGDYSDGSTIYFRVEKTCNLPVQEKVTYSVNFHL